MTTKTALRPRGYDVDREKERKKDFSAHDQRCDSAAVHKCILV